jgi:hypothetical protein
VVFDEERSGYWALVQQEYDTESESESESEKESEVDVFTGVIMHTSTTDTQEEQGDGNNVQGVSFDASEVTSTEMEGAGLGGTEPEQVMA